MSTHVGVPTPAQLVDNGALLNRSSLVPSADDLICAVLRGESPPWPWDPNNGRAADEFHLACRVHGTSPILHQHVPAHWPATITQDLRKQALQTAMWELRHQQVLSETLAALTQHGIEPILIKGTALAYSLYGNPVLRTRGDTDLLINEADKERTHQVLLSLGFGRGSGVSGDFITYQSSYVKDAAATGSHVLDLHWKINNSQVLARLFSYGELRREAQPLHGLCKQALAPSLVHSLLLACMHRSTHRQNPYYVDDVAHYGGNRLIWLLDIHLLAGQLTEQQWAQVTRQATDKGLRRVCVEGMEAAQAQLGTRYPTGVLEELAQQCTPEPAARYLAGSKVRQQWMDFCALTSLPDQSRFIRELFFPPETYMRQKYPGCSRQWLSWLYLRRAVEGIAKRLAPSSTS